MCPITDRFGKFWDLSVYFGVDDARHMLYCG